MPVMYMNPKKVAAPSSVYAMKDMAGASLPMSSVKQLLDDRLEGCGTTTSENGENVDVTYGGASIGRVEQPKQGVFEFISDEGGEHFGLKSIDDVVQDIKEYIESRFEYKTVQKMESVIGGLFGDSELGKALIEGLLTAYNKKIL